MVTPPRWENNHHYNRLLEPCSATGTPATVPTTPFQDRRRRPTTPRHPRRANIPFSAHGRLHNRSTITTTSLNASFSPAINNSIEVTDSTIVTTNEKQKTQLNTRAQLRHQCRQKSINQAYTSTLTTSTR